LRIVLVALLIANLAFLAWARLIDTPPPAPPVSPLTRLPRLQLAAEAAKPAAPAPAPVTTTPSAPTTPDVNAAPAAPAAPPPASAPAPAATAAPAVTGAQGAAPPGTGGAATAVTAAMIAAAGGTHTSRCVSVGPFTDPARAAKAQELLAQRGFAPRQRAERSEPWKGYWVYVGLKNEGEGARTVKRLESGGIHDAHVLNGADGPRVSVGLFTERDGAERRARSVRSLGLTADIVEREQTEADYWVDVDLASSTQALPTDGLVSLGQSGERLEIKMCPAAPGTSAASADHHGIG